MSTENYDKECYECKRIFNGYETVCGKDECDNCGKCWCPDCEDEENNFPLSAGWDDQSEDENEDYEFPPCKYCEETI